MKIKPQNKRITIITHSKNNYQRVETYSVNGGLDEISRARPKSATLITSSDTNIFSAKKELFSAAIDFFANSSI